MSGHGLDRSKTKPRKQPYTCLCGAGPLDIWQLGDHVSNALPQPPPGSQEWMDAADVAALNSAISAEEKNEAAARLDRRARRAKG